MMAQRILSVRELNRATLARQLLLERAHLSAEEGERLMQWVTEKITTWEIVFVEYDGKVLGQNLWGRL